MSAQENTYKLYRAMDMDIDYSYKLIILHLNKFSLCMCSGVTLKGNKHR